MAEWWASVRQDGGVSVLRVGSDGGSYLVDNPAVRDIAVRVLQDMERRNSPKLKYPSVQFGRLCSWRLERTWKASRQSHRQVVNRQWSEALRKADHG